MNDDISETCPIHPMSDTGKSNTAREEVLQIAVLAGEILLRNGAETYRVEETISRICLAYGYSSEPFVLPTGVFASIGGKPSPLSIVRRIKTRAINLGKVAKVNDFARCIEITTLDFPEAMEKLDRIANSKTYPQAVIFASYSLTAAIFTLLYGGNFAETAVAFVIGMLLAIIRLLFAQRFRFPFFEYFMGGFVAGFFSILASGFITNINAYIVVTGALINLMPGTALVNGVRDMLHGDSVSGQARLGEALLMVSILAAGAAIGFGAEGALFHR